MAKNNQLELAIRIGGKVDKSLINAINAAQSNVSSLSTTLSKVGTVGLAAMGALATGTVAALAKCTDAAKDFESQMGDVVKYVDGLADADGLISDKLAGNGKTYAENYATMSDAILSLSTEIPYTAEELTRLAAAAGQSGKSMADLIKYDDDGNITGFLRDVAMMGTAWDISADQAGDWAAKWEVAFSKNHEEIMELADQINYLGAHNATTAAEIAEVVNEAAGLGQVAGMDVDATAALGTAMLAMGVDTAKAANSINRMYTNMSKGASATKAQQEMWKELGFTASGIAASMQSDASGTMLKVFGEIQQLPEERQVAALSTLFGQWAITGAAKLTGNLDTFKQALSDVDNKDLFNGSMNREFIIKSETSEALDTRMKSALNAFQIDIGNAFLPAKKDVSVAIIGFLDTIRNMPELTRVAEMLASMFSTGLEKAGDALENAMPTIEKVLGYLADHGPEVISILEKMVAVFAAMKFAPEIKGLVKGVGSLARGGGTMLTDAILGTRQGQGGRQRSGTQHGGLLGMLRGEGATGGMLSGLGQGLTRAASSTTGLALSGLKGIGTAILNPANLLGALHPANLFGALNGGIFALGNIWGPIAAGFGGLLSSALPIVGAISSIIAGLSLFYDNVDGLGQIVRSVFGEEAFQGFQKFKDGLDSVVNSVGMLLNGDFAGFTENLRETFFGKYDVFTESMIGGIFSGSNANSLVGIFDSLMSGDVIGMLAPLREKLFGTFDMDAGTMMGGMFSGSGANMLVNVFDAVAAGAQALFNIISPIFQSVMGIVGQLVTFANTTVKPIIESIFNFITTTVVPIILQTFTAAAPIISSIISSLGTAIMTVAQIIGTAIQTVMPIIQGLITIFLSIASTVIPMVLGAFEAFSEGISSIMQTVQGIFQGVLTFIRDVFTGNWGQLWGDAVNILGNAFAGIGKLVATPINAMIRAINNISIDVPDGVPIIGGTHIGFNIPEIPMFARGGFTNGPSIAGEAGTEAVISFQRSARASNIATWAKAGQMLGVSNRPARLETFDDDNGGLGWPNGNGGGPVTITYAPTIIIQGPASKEDVDAALREDKARFDAWYEEKKRNERRARW